MTALPTIIQGGMGVAACLCNALTADVGLAQVQKNGDVERPLVTSGDDLASLRRVLHDGRPSYSAADVVTCLLRG